MFSPQKFCRNWATHLFKVLNVSSCSHGNKNLTQVVPIRQIEAIDPSTYKSFKVQLLNNFQNVLENLLTMTQVSITNVRLLQCK